MIAKIAVSAATYAIDKPYSYKIPEGMTLQSGQRVQLPFGRGKAESRGAVSGRSTDSVGTPTAAGGIFAGAVFLHLL